MLLGSAKNCLLVKDDVGVAKPFTRNLPQEEFAFGKVTTFCESAGAGKFTKCVSINMTKLIYPCF